MKDLNCLRCGHKMAYGGSEKFQLGQTGLILGDWPNIMAGALEMEIYVCPGCGKLEFYRAEGSFEEEIPQKVCPNCGKRHDFDYPKCPFCKFEY